MHGDHPKWPYFRVAELPSEARTALCELAARYLVAFYDPGLGMLAPVDHGRIRARAAELKSK